MASASVLAGSPLPTSGAGSSGAILQGRNHTLTAPLEAGSSYRFGPAGLRGRERRRAAGVVRRVRRLLRRLDARRGGLVARRQSTAMPIGMAAMPSAIAALATRSSPCVSVATTTSARTRPAPNINRAVLVYRIRLRPWDGEAVLSRPRKRLIERRSIRLSVSQAGKPEAPSQHICW